MALRRPIPVPISALTAKCEGFEMRADIRRSWPVAIALILLVGILPAACGDPGADECAPDTFGRQCGESGSYLKCSGTSCEDSYGLPCEPHHEISELRCPASRPQCRTRRDTAANDIVCLGQVIGSCNTPGYQRCEDQQTEVMCVLDERGKLVSSRGTCASGQACRAPFPLHAGGCTTLASP